MNIRKFIILFLVALNAATLGAATFELVPVRNVVQGRNFSVTFRLTDGEGSEPAAPELEGCRLLFGPAMSTMHSTQIVNGRMSSSTTVDYTFTYRADTPGTVQIPAVAIRTKSGSLHSQPSSFQILPSDEPAGNSGGASGGQSPRNNGGNVSTDRRPGQISADDLLVRVSFSKSSVYEQEPVVATIKVYTKYDISSFLPTVQPAFEGFLTEELQVDPNVSMEHYNGQNYHTAVLKRLLLYPQRSGRLSVNSGKYNVTIVQYETVNMGFFRTQRPVEREVTTTSNAASIEVRPLPSPKPDNFSGAVGRFSVATKLEPEYMRTNEPSVYSYIVTGTGNIKYLAPVAMSFPTGVESYTPRTNFDTRLVAGGTNMSGTFTTDFTIVPTEVGNFTIEPTPFVYFDPSAGEYKTAQADDTPIHVLRGNGAAPAPERSETVQQIDDILHIHVSNIERQSADIQYTYGTRLYWLIFVLSALILIGTVFLYRRQIRLNADVTGRRLAKAGRVAAKRLKRAKEALNAHKADEFYASLSSALWGYLSDKLNIPASQLTRDNIAEKLSNYGVAEDTVDALLDVLDRCEMARFTPAGSDAEMADIYSKASEAINAVESVKHK